MASTKDDAPGRRGVGGLPVPSAGGAESHRLSPESIGSPAPRCWLRARAPLLAAVLAAPGLALGYTVNTTSDLTDPVLNGFCGTTVFFGCSLRAAIQEGNANANLTTITVPAGRYVLTRAGANEDNALNGDLDILADTVIEGAGAAETIIDANGLDRVFHVHPGVSLTLRDVTVTGGALPSGTGGTGGGIYAYSAAGLHLERTRVVDNDAFHKGAGVYAVVVDELSITDSEISENLLTHNPPFTPYGAGIATQEVVETVITGSTIALNRCPEESPGCNGGIDARSCQSFGVTVRNSTIAANDDDGLYASDCDVDLIHASIVDNGGYGVGFVSYDGGDTLYVRSSIIADNGLGDCWSSGGIYDRMGGQNLASDSSCGLNASLGDLPGTDPQLHPLGLYPAATRSYTPEWSSPVIEAGDSATCTLTTDDQDGYPRPQDAFDSGSAACDIGSIEVAPCRTGIAPGNGLHLLYLGALDPGVYESCTFIDSAGCQIETGDAVEFHARELVKLSGGFAVEQGGSFAISFSRYAGSEP